MLTREVKLKMNRILSKNLDRHLWHLTGVYNWTSRQIELHGLDTYFKEKSFGPFPECYDLNLSYPKSVEKTAKAEKKRKFPPKPRLKVVGISVDEYSLFKKVTGSALRMKGNKEQGISSEAILSMIYQARNAWDRHLKGLAKKPKL